MAVNVVLNGVTYSIPEPGNDAWGQSLTDYFVAQASGLLQKAGGTFSLTAEVDFGTTYGLKSAYFKSRAASPATSGQVRLGNAEGVYWRNAAGSANLGLLVNASDQLEFNGTTIQPAGNYITALTGNVTASGPGSAVATISAGVITNAMINASAAIAYSKLALTGSIVNADISASAAIAYSKLNLTGSIVNADISASAAIAYSKLSLTGSILNADISASAAIALSKLAALTASRVLQSSAGGVIEVSSVTTTELGYLSGVTSAIQTQIDGKTAKSTLTTKGDIYVATGASTPARLAVGSDGQILTADSSQSTGVKWANVGASTAPKVTTYTSGSGTFTKTGSPLYIRVRMVGGGGGGGGGGTGTSGGSGGTGGTSYFRVGASPDLLVANGGAGGTASGNQTSGAGGTASLGTGPTGTAITGSTGTASWSSQGAIGGSSPFGGAGVVTATGSGAAATAAIANTGSGGGGGNSGSGNGGSGGGAGGFVDAIITSPSSTYAYAVGAAGTAGTAGTSGGAGGAGGSGYIEVTEYYQ